MSNAERAVALLRAIASSDVEEAVRHLSPAGFVQHDPAVADGVDGLRDRARQPGEDRLEIARVLEDGPFVVVHGRTGDDGNGDVFFAVLRFEDGLAVEHWRFTARLAPANGSGHTQTDGPAGPSPGQDTDRSKAVVRDYYEAVHIGGQHGQVRRYMSGDVQVRHEPGVHDGVAAFERDLAVLTRSRTIDEVVLLAGQGDLVFVAGRGTHEGEPCAYIDLYRVEDGRLVEHWGFPQAIPPHGMSRNGNGLLQGAGTRT